MILPACMMPDGAEPCEAYQELQVEIERQAHQLSLAHKEITTLRNFISGAQASLTLALRSDQIVNELKKENK